MAALLVMLARCVLVATLLAAPWAIGGAELRHQRWLFLGVAIAGVLAWLGCVLNGSARLSRLSSLMLLTGAALIGVGAFQLAPHPHAPELKRAELTEALQVLVGNDSAATARSLSPADTRLQMGRLALALCAFLCGSWLFGERRARHWLWAILAVNGVALVAFGIIQRASWNDKLYWTIPLQLGGQPFAAFVNRNNAAEYLSMCLSGVLGLWAWRRTLTELPAWSGKARDGKTGWFERIPATPWAVLILMLFGGVFATLSRGGALSAAAAILVIGVWAGATGRARTILLPLIGIVVAAGVWIAVSQQRDQLQARLSTVTRSLATDDRVGHWTDMVRALQDFSPWGSGLGAYRYANKPYERRKSEIWFDSADNQYLELLVDGGAVAGIVIVGALVLALVAAERWRRCGSLGEALAAGYLLIAIGLQSITNCWWMVSANVLTLATLAGALSGPARELDDLSMSPLDKVRQLIESRGGVVSAAVAGLCVLIVAGLGLYEVTLAAESAEFRRRVPDDELRGALADVELDGLLILGEQLAVRRSDDAELHAALARLHYYRYRNQAAATLDAVAPARWSEAVRWERTSPSSLFATLARYRQIGDASAVARFRDAPTVKADFEPISEHLLAARRSCPILPRLGLYEAIHELLNEGDPSLPLRREAALSPASVKLLLSLARSAEMIDDAELFETCLARCLALDPAATTLYVETARRRLSEPQIVERLLPAVPRQLLDFAEAARSSAGRAQALQRASDLIDSERVPEPERLWHRARIARLSEDLAGAVELFAQSVEADPIEPNRRLDYASALFAHGDRAGALEQLATARRLAQEDRRVQSRADELDDLLKAPRR